jgi:hypothetical protein
VYITSWILKKGKFKKMIIDENFSESERGKRTKRIFYENNFLKNPQENIFRKGYLADVEKILKRYNSEKTQ